MLDMLRWDRSLSGSAQSKSQISPVSGTSVGRTTRLTWPSIKHPSLLSWHVSWTMHDSCIVCILNYPSISAPYLSHNATSSVYKRTCTSWSKAIFTEGVVRCIDPMLMSVPPDRTRRFQVRGLNRSGHQGRGQQKHKKPGVIAPKSKGRLQKSCQIQ